MRFLDLLTMSINNLRRRKVRTALTVLGVVIGNGFCGGHGVFGNWLKCADDGDVFFLWEHDGH